MRRQILIKNLFISKAHAIPFHEEVPEGQCANCGTALSGAHCTACGQKARVRKDFSLGSFFGEAIHQFTHFDSKFLKSFRALLFRPGELTVAYLRGKRKKYMQPMQLFVIINILYFLFLHFFPITTFTSYLNIQYSQLPYSKSVVRPLVDQKVDHIAAVKISEIQKAGAVVTDAEKSKIRDESYQEYAKEFDSSIGGLAKTLVVLMIPLLAIELAILYLLRRFYFVEHLVFATHFFTFFLILVSAGVTLFMLPLELIMEKNGGSFTDQDLEALITFGPGILAGLYLFMALRKVYRETYLVTFLKTTVVMFALIPVINIYRLILFYITFYVATGH